MAEMALGQQRAGDVAGSGERWWGAVPGVLAAVLIVGGLFASPTPDDSSSDQQFVSWFVRQPARAAT